MNREDLRLAGCEGKAAYSSWWRAVSKAKAMTRKFHGSGEYFLTYRCTACHHIHIGSNDAMDKRQFTPDVKRKKQEAGVDIPGLPNAEDSVVY